MTLEEGIEYYERLVENQKRIFEKYPSQSGEEVIDRFTQLIEWLKAYRDDRDDLTALRAYWAEQQANPPLTWDELKQMEGKPVWVEQHHGDTKGWLLILRKCDDVVTCTTKHGNSFYLYKANYGEKWQAYRKERE